VSEDERRLHHVAADPAVLEVVHVRSAHAHRGHPDQHLVRARLRLRALLDDQVADGPQDADPHAVVT
jgi:hypothetical protein